MCEGPAALDTVLAGVVAEMEQRGSWICTPLDIAAREALSVAAICQGSRSGDGLGERERRSLDSHCARIDSRSRTRCSERSKAMAELREQTGSDKAAIRPFRVNNVPEAELTELRRRINATKW